MTLLKKHVLPKLLNPFTRGSTNDLLILELEDFADRLLEVAAGFKDPVPEYGIIAAVPKAGFGIALVLVPTG